MKSPISSDTEIIRNEKLLSAEVEEEFIALDADSGQCYGLNSVASAAWRLLGIQTSVQEICKRLITEYDVAPEVCEEEIKKFVISLHQEGLIRIITGPSGQKLQ
jgi:hypothetical protein